MLDEISGKHGNYKKCIKNFDLKPQRDGLVDLIVGGGHRVIKTDCKGMGWVAVDRIHVALNRDKP